MKKFTYCIILVLTSLKIQAQTVPPTPQQIAQQDQQFWSQALVNISSQITSGILYSKVNPFSNLYNYNTLEHNIANSSLFTQALAELHNASDKMLFIPVEQLNIKKQNLHLAKGSATTPLIDIGLLNTSFDFLFYDDENESNGGLYLVNNVFQPIAGKPSVFTKHITLISPQQEIITTTNSGNVNFKLENTLFFNRSKPIKTLVANFDTSTSFTLVNNSIPTNTTASLNYSTFGEKLFTFTITYQDNSTQTTYAKATVVQPEIVAQKSSNCDKTNIIPFTSSIAHQAWDENTAKFGELEYKIFYANNNQTGACDLSRIQKPFIVIDGFDPGDKRRIETDDCLKDPNCQKLNEDADGNFITADYESIYELMKYSNNPNDNIVKKLQAENYDVIIINLPTIRATYDYKKIIHDYGADYIERNAMTLVSFIQEINTNLSQNSSTEELVVVGPSMGGQITRYALAYMEKKEQETNNSVWDHNTRLWVSVDSPHQGANIPLSVQGSTYFLGFVNGDEGAKQTYEESLQSPAAKQMLMDHYDNIRYGQTRSPYFINYQAALYANGLSNSNGYPTKSRNIAIANGSLTGKTEANAGQRFLDMRGKFNIKWWLIVQHNWTINLFTTKNNYQQHFNQSGLVYDTRAYKESLNFYNSTSITRTNTNWQGSLDVVPGGLFNSGNDYKEQIIATLKKGKYKRVMFTPSTESDLVVPHSFISTHSALDTNGFNDWYKSIDKDIVCSGQTPFDTYYGEENNTPHVSFTQESKNWLFDELNKIQKNPTVYNNFDNTSLTGDLAVCDNKTNTYTLDLPNSCSGLTITWSSSSNINIVSSTNNTVTVRPVNGTNEIIGHVSAYVQEKNINLDKVVWVGIPSPNFLSINIIGNYNFYATQWTKLKVIHLAPPMELMGNDPNYGLTYEWSVPNSQVRSFSDTSTIDVNPFSTGQLNIGVKMYNQCGCTNFKYQLFNVIQQSTSGGGGGGGSGPVLSFPPDN